MSTSKLSALALALCSLQASGCSWSRFDDVTTDAPIAILEKPGSMNAGFGLTATSAVSEDSVLLLVGGAFGVSSASAFELGTGQSPTTDARDREYCDGSAGTCFLADAPAGLDRVNLVGEEHSLCFALGLGSTPVQGNGLVLRCDDRVMFSYAVPESYRDHVDFAIEVSQPEVVALAGDGSAEPWLLAGAAAAPTAWYYPFGTVSPIELLPPGQVPASYGKRVVAAASGSTRLLAVAAPDEDQLYLFRANADGREFIGCLGGTPGFGSALATGVVLGDDQVPDLVVSDATSVHVFDGKTLLDLPATTGSVCTLAALPAGGLISSFGCGSTDDISGCAGSRFGEALAVGDLDGDGDGEVAVGAPGMAVRGNASGGAVLVWDLEQRGDSDFAEAKFMSSAESNDQLGAALAMPRIGDHNIIAAGAPGRGDVALFYCSSLLPAELQGDRCR